MSGLVSTVPAAAHRDVEVGGGAVRGGDQPVGHAAQGLGGVGRDVFPGSAVAAGEDRAARAHRDEAQVAVGRREEVGGDARAGRGPRRVAIGALHHRAARADGDIDAGDGRRAGVEDRGGAARLPRPFDRVEARDEVAARPGREEAVEAVAEPRRSGAAGLVRAVGPAFWTPGKILPPTPTAATAKPVNTVPAAIEFRRVLPTGALTASSSPRAGSGDLRRSARATRSLILPPVHRERVITPLASPVMIRGDVAMVMATAAESWPSSTRSTLAPGSKKIQ